MKLLAPSRFFAHFASMCIPSKLLRDTGLPPRLFSDFGPRMLSVLLVLWWMIVEPDSVAHPRSAARKSPPPRTSWCFPPNSAVPLPARQLPPTRRATSPEFGQVPADPIRYRTFHSFDKSKSIPSMPASFSRCGLINFSASWSGTGIP